MEPRKEGVARTLETTLKENNNHNNWGKVSNLTNIEGPFVGFYALGVFKLKSEWKNKFQNYLFIISIIFGRIQNKLFVLRQDLQQWLLTRCNDVHMICPN